jgi:phosphoribosylanthranilate isomerase
MNHVETFGLDMVQVHGNETPYYCDKLADQVQLVKAFRFAEYDHVEWMIKDFYHCTDMFMFDTGTVVQGGTDNWKGGELQYGGPNRKFNWRRLSGLNISKPFFLSGGIEPTDAGDIKQFLKDPVAKDLFAIDVNSRFESSPGVKDMQKLKAFVDELKV